jgi:hypothetical protein
LQLISRLGFEAAVRKHRAGRKRHREHHRAGVPAGTVFYAEVLNGKGQIVYITPNSEAGILGRSTSTVPEPGSISLMITGLCGIAGGGVAQAARLV